LGWTSRPANWSFLLKSSDNEEAAYEDFDDYSDNDDIFIDDDDDDVQLAQPAHHAPPPPAPPSRMTRSSGQHQPPPPLQGYLPPGAFQAGFGGNAFARPPASMFRRGYRAFSTAILEVQQGRGHLGGGSGRSNLMYGGKSELQVAEGGGQWLGRLVSWLADDWLVVWRSVSRDAGLGPARIE